MKLADRDAFYEKMYFHEIDERDRLNEQFRTLLAIVAVVFALISFLFNVVINDAAAVPFLFWFIFAAAILAFAASITCYIKAWHSQYYNAFPLLRDIEAYIQQIRDHYQQSSDERTAELWTEEAFDDFMRQSFVEHSSFNARANDNKRFWLYYGNSFIIAAFVFSIMACIPVSSLLFT